MLLPELAPIKNKKILATFQDGELTVYWDKTSKTMVFVDTDSGCWLDLVTYKVDTKEKALEIATKLLTTKGD